MTKEGSVENLMTKEGSVETDFSHNLSDGMNLCFLKKKQQQKKSEIEAP